MEEASDAEQPATSRHSWTRHCPRRLRHLSRQRLRFQQIIFLFVFFFSSLKMANYLQRIPIYPLLLSVLYCRHSSGYMDLLASFFYPFKVHPSISPHGLASSTKSS
ncbi:hypothetical protein Ancab_026488 [Ancistrocladus abbreviatus]